MNNPLVSVIIPAYNAEKFIAEALDSVFAQRYYPIEVIVVDDGSTDKTAKIVRSYQKNVRDVRNVQSVRDEQDNNVQDDQTVRDVRTNEVIEQIKQSNSSNIFHEWSARTTQTFTSSEAIELIYIYQKNGGPSMARNTGIKRASGKYITFLDADDLWSEGKLQKQIELMEIHKEVVLMFGDVRRFFENNGIADSMFIRRGITKEFFGDSFYVKNAYKKLLTRNYIPTGTVIIRRRYFQYRDIFDENFRCVEDWDLWLRIAMDGTIAYSTDIWELKRDHKNNVSNNVDAMLLAMIEVLKKHEKNFQPYLRKNDINFKNYLCDSYVSLGFYYLDRNQKQKARETFLKSLHNGIHIKSIFYWFTTFFNYHKAKKSICD